MKYGIALLVLGMMPAPATAQEFTSSNLPVIVIDVDQEIPDEPKVMARMGIIDNGPGLRNNRADLFNAYDGFIGIELRGSSSQSFPKKSYAVETWDAEGDDIDVELLGFPEEEDWILHGPYSDKSLMRNVMIYDLARRLGHYASRVRFVELVLNDDYRGVYVLMEKIKRDDHRVDISKLNPDEITGDDLTGGYILKIDKFEGSELGGWTSPYPPYPGAAERIFYQYHEPEPSEIVPEQEAYIQGVIGTFEDVMASDQYADPAEGYAKYIDVDAAVDFFLLNELTKNVDGYRLSTFFYKDKDSNGGKLVMGPIWDFNLGFGNANYYEGDVVEGFQVHYRPSGDAFQFPFWWPKLWDEPAFNEAARRRWNALRNGPFHPDSLAVYIDDAAALLDEAQARNFKRWPILNDYVWPNPVITGSYTGEIAYLKDWIARRTTWMDSALPPVVVSTEPVPGVPEAFHLTGPYPNPFHTDAQMYLRITRPQHVTVAMFDLLGREITRLYDGPLAAGPSYAFPFEADRLPNGVYLIRIAGEDFTAVRPVMRQR